MGNYVFDAAVLVEALHKDAADEGSRHSMGGDIIPMLVRERAAHLYDFRQNEVPGAEPRDLGYWREVGTIDSYFEAHMDPSLPPWPGRRPARPEPLTARRPCPQPDCASSQRQEPRPASTVLTAPLNAVPKTPASRLPAPGAQGAAAALRSLAWWRACWRSGAGRGPPPAVLR